MKIFFISKASAQFTFGDLSIFTTLAFPNFQLSKCVSGSGSGLKLSKGGAHELAGFTWFPILGKSVVWQKLRRVLKQLSFSQVHRLKKPRNWKVIWPLGKANVVKALRAFNVNCTLALLYIKICCVVHCLKGQCHKIFVCWFFIK